VFCCSCRKAKSPEPEPEVDPERDQRTVFAYQISLKADERDLYEFFSRAGKVIKEFQRTSALQSSVYFLEDANGLVF
jgi:RNA recognition motif-containing protein